MFDGIPSNGTALAPLAGVIFLFGELALLTWIIAKMERPALRKVAAFVISLQAAFFSYLVVLDAFFVATEDFPKLIVWPMIALCLLALAACIIAGISNANGTLNATPYWIMAAISVGNGMLDGPAGEMYAIAIVMTAIGYLVLYIVPRMKLKELLLSSRIAIWRLR